MQILIDPIEDFKTIGDDDQIDFFNKTINLEDEDVDMDDDNY